jgi:hypothetical protein
LLEFLKGSVNLKRFIQYATPKIWSLEVEDFMDNKRIRIIGGSEHEVFNITMYDSNYEDITCSKTIYSPSHLFQLSEAIEGN